MNNEPVAWINKTTLQYMTELGYFAKVYPKRSDGDIPLYTQDQLEEARKLGMQQERAMWNLSASTQEIMDTHPVKELEPKIRRACKKCIEQQAEIEAFKECVSELIKWHCYRGTNDKPQENQPPEIQTAMELLRKAQEK